QAAQWITSAADETGHQLIREDRLAPVGVRSALSARVFHRYGDGTGPLEFAVLGFGARAGELGIARASTGEQFLMRPDCADADHVSHLVGDNVVECSLRLHLGQIRGVKGHGPLDWDESGFASVGWAKVCRTCLTQNPVWAVN